jgi:hypothetical protein
MKPCPFNPKHRCLGAFYFAAREEKGAWRVRCECGAAGPSAETEKEAIELWNKRAE